MKLLRQGFSVALIAALICFTTQSADFHVHAAEHADADHHHGPALHHHEAAARSSVNGAHIRAVDEDDTVVPVLLCAASAGGAKSSTARSIDVRSIEPPTASIGLSLGVIARAHGPPPFRADSLRAPPASQPL